MIWREMLESYEAPSIDAQLEAELREFVTVRRRELGD